MFKIILTSVLVFSVFSAQSVAAMDIIGTEEIRPGMKGYGLTVFKGTEPERFGVEVISVVPNFLLRQNIILIRCDHPITDKAGVIGGMSGSPVFIEGRLAGALAYGWRFGKEPLAGVTSIEDMLDVLKLKQRGSGIGRWGRIAIKGGALQRRQRTESASYGGDYFGIFQRQESGQLLPARTPVTLGGFLGPAREMVAKALSKFGIDPVAGGGTKGGKGPTKFVSGSAIGIQLIRGDMSATAIGTVTAIDKKNVLAFGHPMFNMGEGYLPVTTARIHTVIASFMRSNKLGSPLNEAGSLVQDRSACIVARTDRQARMIPVKVTIHDERSKRRETYEVDIALHRFLTPKFLQAALANIIMHAASDVEDVTAEIKGVMNVTGRSSPITLYDSGASRNGLMSLTSYFRPVSVVSSVLNNPFEDAAVTSLEFDVKLKYGLDVATILGAYLTAEEPEPGEVVNVHVRLRKYDASERILTVPVRVPTSAAGKKIQVEVAGGDFITPAMPLPQNLDDLIKNVTRYYPPKSLVVGINIPGEGVSLRGRVIERLPSSVVDALQPAAGRDQITRHRTALRKVTKTPFLIEGKEIIHLTVGGHRNR